jgi:parallel beta-helix repeat protein
VTRFTHNPSWRFVATTAALGLALASIHSVTAEAAAGGSASRIVEAGESIQAAIDASPPGAHIRIKAGSYREQLLITKDRITLDADAGTILRPPTTLVANGCTGMTVLGRVATAPPANAGICVSGEVTFGAWEAIFQHKPVIETKRAVTGVTVSGFDIAGFGVGIALAGTPKALVEKNYIVSGGQFAIVTSAAPNSIVRGNQLVNPIQSPSVIGICLEGSAYSTLTRNDISGFINGICLASSHVVLAGNRLVDNHVGLFVDPGYEDIEVRHNVIDRNNRVEPGATQLRTGTGMIIEGARDVRVFGNDITNNTSDNLAKGLPLGAAGIIIRDASPTVVASKISIRLNRITGNGLDPNGNLYRGAFDVINLSIGTEFNFEHNWCASSRPLGLCDR